MALKLSLTQLSQILNFQGENQLSVSQKNLAIGITTDTRSLLPGEVFLALKGISFDGHDFVETAIDKGAIALITERPISVKSVKNIPQFQVNNTLVAYQKIAHWWRNQFSFPVIAVTGSVGKTTTKELIAAVLSTQGKVHKTQANYNNEIGVPKTLLELDSSDDYAVIEMAMRAAGEIALLTQITQPTIGVITNVGTAHIGRLGSQQAIAQAKCELLSQMPKTSIAILNQDDQRLIETAAQFWQGETLTYGLNSGELNGQLLDVSTLKVNNQVFGLPLPGRHNALNYLAALAVAKVLGIDWTVLTQGISVELPGSRAKCYSLAEDILLLDETYNAGLESMLAALQLLKETPAKRQIAVLGTMKELGDRSWGFHHQVGEKVKALGIDWLFVLITDPETEAIAIGAKGVPTECFTTKEALIQRLQERVEPGDRILFKASNSVGLNRVVEALRVHWSSVDQS